MRTWLLMALCMGCSRQDVGSDARSPQIPQATADAGPAITSDAAVDGSVESKAAFPLDAGTDAAPAQDSYARFEGKVILHAGDSMVGDGTALTHGLADRFAQAGAKKFVSDTWVSASLITFAGQPRLARLLSRSNPDVVIVTLGTNDVHVPNPTALLGYIRSVVKRIGARECYWIGPLFIKKQDTGIVELLKNNVAPCTFYDSSKLEIPRTKDRIHPTHAGGEQWADAFWQTLGTQPSVLDRH